MRDLWKNNAVQFPRLIVELESAGAFTPEVMEYLCSSMDLHEDNISELIDRAEVIWNKAKAPIDWPITDPLVNLPV